MNSDLNLTNSEASTGFSSNKYRKNSYRRKKNSKKPFKQLDVDLEFENTASINQTLVRKARQTIKTVQVDIFARLGFKFYLKQPEPLKWDNVHKVEYYTQEEYKCPVCLHENMITPVILPCTHVFCWPCLKLLDQGSEEPKCPMCYELFDQRQARLACLHKTAPVEEGQKVKFNLLMTKRNCATYSLASDPCLSTFEEKYKTINLVPREEWPEFKESRVVLSTRKNEDYEKCTVSLSKAIEEEKGFFNEAKTVKALEQCLEESIALKEEKWPEIEQEKVETVQDWRNFDFYYVSSTCPTVFLHRFTDRILNFEFRSVDKLPSEIEGVVLEKELRQHTRKIYDNLSNLQLGTIFEVAELEIPNLSKRTLEKFSSEMEKKRSERQFYKEQEEKYNILVTESKLIEEEKMMKRILRSKKFVREEVDFVELETDCVEAKNEAKEEENKIALKDWLDSKHTEESKVFTFKDEEFPEL